MPHPPGPRGPQTGRHSDIGGGLQYFAAELLSRLDRCVDIRRADINDPMWRRSGTIIRRQGHQSTGPHFP